MEAFAAKSKAQQQREELKTWIQYTMGQSKWDELIRMEANIRKTRQETLYRQRERRQRFLEWLAIIGIGTVTFSFILFIVYLYINR